MAKLISASGLHGDVITSEGLIKFEKGVAEVPDEIAEKLTVGDIRVVKEAPKVDKEAEAKAAAEAEAKAKAEEEAKAAAEAEAKAKAEEEAKAAAEAEAKAAEAPKKLPIKKK